MDLVFPLYCYLSYKLISYFYCVIRWYAVVYISMCLCLKHFNPCGADIRMLQENWNHAMGPDALSPCVARSSSAMVLMTICIIYNISYMGLCLPWTMISITSVLFHQQPRYQGSWGQHGAHLGPTGPRWAPCWPHESCYQGMLWS